MFRVNFKFVEIFIDYNFLGFLIFIFFLFIMERGEIFYVDIEVIEKFFELDFILIFFGDVFVDVV